jgi:hypothetical protein
LASNRVTLTDEAKESLRQMHPNDQREVIGVIVILASDDFTKEIGRLDLGIQGQDGTPIWGYEDPKCWISFADEDDGSLTITSVNLRSRFRPPGLGRYGFDI